MHDPTIVTFGALWGFHAQPGTQGHLLLNYYQLASIQLIKQKSNQYKGAHLVPGRKSLVGTPPGSQVFFPGLRRFAGTCLATSLNCRVPNISSPASVFRVMPVLRGTMQACWRILAPGSRTYQGTRPKPRRTGVKRSQDRFRMRYVIGFRSAFGH